MNTIFTSLAAIALAALVGMGAAAKESVIGLSPHLPKEVKERLIRDVVTYVGATLARGETAYIVDAAHQTLIGAFTVPDVIGYDGVKARIHAARPGVPCVTPITAALAALERFSATRIAVLTPYVDEVNAVIDAHLTQAGIDIAAFTSFGIEDNEEMAALAPDAIYQAALHAGRPEAEALFISCTAIRAVEVVERIEQTLGKPVITANQAMFWQALRATGCDLKSPGYGRLLRMD